MDDTGTLHSSGTTQRKRPAGSDGAVLPVQLYGARVSSRLSPGVSVEFPPNAIFRTSRPNRPTEPSRTASLQADGRFPGEPGCARHRSTSVGCAA